VVPGEEEAHQSRHFGAAAQPDPQDGARGLEFLQFGKFLERLEAGEHGDGRLRQEPDPSVDGGGDEGVRIVQPTQETLGAARVGRREEENRLDGAVGSGREAHGNPPHVQGKIEHGAMLR